MPGLRHHISLHVRPDTPKRRLNRAQRREADLPAHGEERHLERPLRNGRVEEPSVRPLGLEVLEGRAEKAGLLYGARIDVEQVLRDDRVAGVRGVPEIPGEILALLAPEEELRDVRDREEGELPLRAGGPAGARGLEGLVDAAVDAGDGVLDHDGALDEGAVVGGESGGEADALVVRDDVGLADVEEVQDAFEVFAGDGGGVVVIESQRGLAAAAVVRSDDGVVLCENWADGVPSVLKSA